MDFINFISILGLLITFVSPEKELIGFGILDPPFAEGDKISQKNRQNHIIEGRPAVKKSIRRPVNKRIQPVIMKTESKSVPKIDVSKDTTPNDNNSKTLPINSRYNKKAKLIKIIREPYYNRIVLKSKFEEDTDKSRPSDIYVHKQYNNDSTVNAKNMDENKLKNSTIVSDNKIVSNLHLTESPEKGTNKSDTQLETKSKEADKIKSSDTDKTRSPRVTFKNIIDMYKDNDPKKKMEHSSKIHNKVIPEVLTAKTNNHYTVKYDETLQKKTSSYENETQRMQPKVMFEENFRQPGVDNSLNNTFSIPESHGSELNLDIIQNENLNFENVFHENKLQTDLPSQYLTESDLFNESVPQPTDGHLIIDGRMNPLQNYNHMDGSLYHMDEPIEPRIKIDIIKEEEIDQDTVNINPIDRIANDEIMNLSENLYHYQDESKKETTFSSASSQYYPSVQTGRFESPIRFTICGTPTMNCNEKPSYINQFSRNLPNFGILRNYFNQEYNPYGRIWRSWKSSEIIIGNLKNSNEMINLNKFILNNNNGRNIYKYRMYKYPVVIGY